MIEEEKQTRDLGVWYDTPENTFDPISPFDYHYMDWVQLLPGHEGRRRGTVYPGREGHKYRIVLEQYGMTPSYEREEYAETKEEAIAIVNRFLYGEEVE